MPPSATRATVEGHLSRVATPIFEGVAAGVEMADRIMRTVPNRDNYPAFRSMATRIGAREHWINQGLGPGWHIAGNPAMQAQTLLVNPAAGIEMRFLRERRRSYPGGVPVAGHNAARREAWSQSPLPFTLSGDPSTQEAIDEIILLLLWDMTTDGDIQVRVVHPLEPGVYGRAVPVDMEFQVQPGGTLFSRLSYEGDDQNENLFAHIDRADNEGDGMNGLFGA
ncbi:hypothetical protein KW076_01590 [Micrococcus porci]|uniref:hypothetical protein n=1 Tax=Micrococcus porci TaxID=2856555 RepID=UPI001CCBD4A4|nr:hypothetical protein [Micrococcus porci]UBH24919.1 hypothetical protein KW076_01590 [Micrococcus porci]